MTGTEKQAKWAEDIKAELTGDVERMVGRAGATLDEFLSMDLPDAKITRDILAVEDHRFWIDVAREKSVAEIANDPSLAEYGIDKSTYGF